VSRPEFKKADWTRVEGQTTKRQWGARRSGGPAGAGVVYVPPGRVGGSAEADVTEVKKNQKNSAATQNMCGSAGRRRGVEKA